MDESAPNLLSLAIDKNDDIDLLSLVAKHKIDEAANSQVLNITIFCAFKENVNFGGPLRALKQGAVSVAPASWWRRS